MSVDRSFARSVQDWLEEDLSAVPDPRPVYDRVFMQLPTTPQRRRWWVPIRSRWRSGASGPGDPWAPIKTGRHRSMASAFKVVAVVGLVMLGSGVLLSNAPRNSPGGGSGSAPAAPTASGSASPAASPAVLYNGSAPFTGTLVYGACPTDPTTTAADGYTQKRGQVCHPMMQVDDPRISGQIDVVINLDSYPVGAGGTRVVAWNQTTISNDQGSWTGSGITLGPDDVTGQSMSWVVGHGAYEGLTAVWSEVDGIGSATVEGAIVTGPLPPTVVAQAP